MNLMEAIIAQKLIGGGGGGGGGSDNAVLYTEQTLTADQKAQARANIGAVSLDEIGTVFTLKGGVATVADLPASGNRVGDVYYVEAVSSGYIWLTSASQPNGYWEELGETIDLSAYELKPIVNAPSGDTVTIAPVANNIYECGTLVSLTISNPPAQGMYTVFFTSGSTPTDVALPPEIKMPDGFKVEANREYEINVYQNRAVVGSWAVTA